MSVQFRMPALGADMTEGTVVEWRIAPGATIRRGDVVMLVETAKGIIDVEAFHDGTVEKLLVEPGSLVPVGTPLALFSGEEAPTETTAPVAAASAAPRVQISPAARRRAEAAGIAIETLVGTGPDGVVTLADVDKAVAGSTALPSSAATAASSQSAMRRAIGAAMARSKREIPHYYLAHTLDFSPVRDWLERFNAGRPVEERLLYAVLLVKAVARACREIPGFAGFYRSGEFQPARDIDVGFAVAQRGGGLVAPGLLEPATKDWPTLMHELKDLVARARGGHLRSSELERPAITLTSLGDEGVDAAYPIIFPDQVAIVAAGRIAERPWVVADKVEPRPVLTLTLAADHRVTDGRAGSRFLTRVAALLSAPGEL